MAKRTALVTAAIGITLLFGSTYTIPAQAAGSDVVHYPAIDAHRGEAIEQHYDIGVPVPRVRVFNKAPWAPLSSSREH